MEHSQYGEKKENKNYKKEVKIGFFNLEQVRPRIFEHTEDSTTDNIQLFFCLHKVQYKSMRLHIRKHFLIAKELLKNRTLCLWGRLNVPEDA